MRQAFFYKKEENGLRCGMCQRNCLIPENKRGFCNVRENRKGKLYLLTYGKPCSIAIDPIEKKPFYHFYPGSKALSIATVGCNLRCLFCQNWEISQSSPEDVSCREASPKELVAMAKKNQCDGLAYTYTEPTVFYEYAYDTAKIAKKQGLYNVFVTNGLIEYQPLKKISKYLDASNIDLKGFNEEYYKRVCGCSLDWVLEGIKNHKKLGIWVELTYLVVPSYKGFKGNNNLSDIKKMCKWIAENAGKETPLHFSGFYPCYKLLNIPPAPKEFLLKARETALKQGLKYVYSYSGLEGTNKADTYCWNCGKVLIKRDIFSIKENKLKTNKCPFCNAKIDIFLKKKN